MKIYLKDITFLILVRIDSVERLENVIIVSNIIAKYFQTNIIIREAASYCNGILKSILKKGIIYQFVEDKDPVLYKTKHFNNMASIVSTPYLAIWDADIIPDKKALINVVKKLRDKEADVALPYNGKCLNITDILRKAYFKNNDIKFLYRNVGKMKLLHNRPLVGGAVLINKEKYIEMGMENEIYYGWGNDDFDRYYRFIKYGLKIYKSDNFLFHLHHPRNSNSKYASESMEMSSSLEFIKTIK